MYEPFEFQFLKFLQVAAVLCYPVIEYLRFGQRNLSFSQSLGLDYLPTFFLNKKNVWKIKYVKNVKT